MKTLKVSYKELMWEIPWGTILRMLYDLPNQKYNDKKDNETKKDAKELTPQTASEFSKYIEQINQRTR